MKKIKKFAIIFLSIIVLAGIIVYIWQRDNINSLYTALTKDTSEISDTIKKQQQEYKEELKKYNVEVQIPDLDISEALLNGDVSSEEVKEQLGINKSTSTDEVQNSDNPSENNNVNNESTNQQEEITENELLNDCASELAAIQVDLMAQLGQLMNEAKNKLYSMDKSEQTEAAKQSIALEGLDKCYELEKTIDSQVSEVINSYKSKINEIGGDTSVLDTLWDYYVKEKNSQKSYYISKFLD